MRDPTALQTLRITRRIGDGPSQNRFELDKTPHLMLSLTPAGATPLSGFFCAAGIALADTAVYNAAAGKSRVTQFCADDASTDQPTPSSRHLATVDVDSRIH